MPLEKYSLIDLLALVLLAGTLLLALRMMLPSALLSVRQLTKSLAQAQREAKFYRTLTDEISRDCPECAGRVRKRLKESGRELEDDVDEHDKLVK